MFADSIASAAPALKVTSATPVTAGCRMIKDAHEVALMRLACEATLKCYEAVYKALAARHDAGPGRRAAHRRLRAPRLSGRRQRPGRRVHRAAPRLADAADDSRRHDHHDGQRLHRRGLPVGHHAHLRPRQGDRQDEEGLRHRPPGADRRAEGGPARRPARGHRRRRPQGDRRRRLRARASSTSRIASATAWAWTGTSGRTS